MAPIKIALFLAGVSLPFFAQTGGAQQLSCAERYRVLDHLKSKYSEGPVAIGLANNGGVLEVLSSPEGKTWTIILTLPNGPTCMVAAGENWEIVSPKPKGEKS